MSSFNILLFGVGNVGITSFIDIFSQMKRQKINKIRNESIIYNSLILETEKDDIIINMFDSAPKEIYEASIKSDALIFMLDLTNKNSILNIEKHIQNYENIYGTNNPILILGNKYDNENVKIFQDEINTFLNKIKSGRNIQYFNISCINKYNIDNPFKFLINHFTNSKDTNINYIGKSLCNNEDVENNIDTGDFDDEILNELLSKLNTIDLSQNINNIDDFSNVIEINHNIFNFSK